MTLVLSALPIEMKTQLHGNFFEFNIYVPDGLKYFHSIIN